MNKSKLVGLVLTGWLVAEIVAFVFVVEFLGVFAAIALGAATTLIGLADIKRLLAYLRVRLTSSRKGVKRGGRLLEGSLQAASSILLILPGFASDLVGLALKSPSIRAALARRIRQGRARRGAQTVDLAPTEWKSLDDLRGRS